MDGFVLTIFLALAALSCVPVDWKNDERSAMRQVLITACGLVVLVAYVMYRAMK
jgi:hypothetical protein